MSDYQDRWIRGVTESRGERACDDRYAVIRDVVARYQRPVTILDIGANLGYFGCRLADEFGAVSVMIDRRPELVAMCQANALPTTIAITRRVSVRDLEELAASEHIDLVLALNVLHHFADWRGALSAVLRLGERIIIETPGAEDRGSCNYRACGALLDAVLAERPTVIGDARSHVTAGVRRPILLLERSKPTIAKGYAYRERMGGKLAVRAHRIESSDHDKVIAYADGEVRAWYPGINLWNWCQLGGSFPDRQDVAYRVAAVAAEEPHGDLRPWNFVLQGERVVAIDQAHRHTHGDAVALDETLAWIQDPERAYRCSA